MQRNASKAIREGLPVILHMNLENSSFELRHSYFAFRLTAPSFDFAKPLD
jgi:hypothetical protein